MQRPQCNLLAAAARLLADALAPAAGCTESAGTIAPGPTVAFFAREAFGTGTMR